MIEMTKRCIGDLGKVIGGATPSTKDPSFWDGDVPWITPKDLASYSSRYICGGNRSITVKGASSCSTTLLTKGSVLFSSRAPIGYIAIAGKDLCTNQGFKSIIPNEETDSLFLYYLLRSNKDYIASLGSGTTFKEISGRTFGNIQLGIPKKKSDQEAIAAILDSLDSKIELNSQINDYLAELAKIRFESELSAKSVLVRMEDIVALEDSKRIPLNSRDREQRKGPYPYYGATSIVDYVDDYLFDGIRVLLGEDGTVVGNDGKPILQYVWGKYWVNNHAHILKAAKDYSLEAIYMGLARTSINHIITGAVQMKISQRNLKTLELEMPPAESLNDYLESIFAAYRINCDENHRLNRLRDILLPKLMSGEIDVSQVDLKQLNNHLCDY